MADPTRRAAAARGRRRFRPTPWATVFTILGLAALIGLGTWQLQRLEWKEELIAQRHGRATEAAVPLPDDLNSGADLDFTRVELTGRFLHDRELYMSSRTLKGAVGYHVITPFLLSDGRTILVNRGWVPLERRDPASRADGQVTGDGSAGGALHIEALLRSGGWSGWSFTRPANDAAGNLWLWFDLPAMAEVDALARPITGYYAEALPLGPLAALPQGAPRAVAGAIELRNEHLGYALTWYALALALLVIFLVFSTRREQGKGAAPCPRRSRP